jgi:lysophospholipase L1-like esterase
MNPVGLYFASGESLYIGAALLLLAVIMSIYLKRRRLPLRNLLTFSAFALIVMACPPFSWGIDAVFLTTFAMWLFTSNLASRRQAQVTLRVASTVVLLMMLLLFPAIELSHRAMPVIAGEASDHLVVIGDSISSGVDPHVDPWPLVLQQITGIPVKNLARPGAGTAEAQAMAKSIIPHDHLLLIEIGGNDLLAGVKSSEFEGALDTLLARVVTPGRTVLMFELPLLPHKIAYGQIQRRLAAKYGIYLIPKRFFTGVIGSADATSDGLHLSKAGSRRMAILVAGILSPVLKSPDVTNSPSLLPNH